MYRFGSITIFAESTATDSLPDFSNGGVVTPQFTPRFSVGVGTMRQESWK
jgi:hypothetical protein